MVLNQGNGYLPDEGNYMMVLGRIMGVRHKPCSRDGCELGVDSLNKFSGSSGVLVNVGCTECAKVVGDELRQLEIKGGDFKIRMLVLETGKETTIEPRKRLAAG